MPIKFKPGGINFNFDPANGGILEAHSSTCFHCQAITDFPSKKEMMNYVDVCRGCMRLICLACVGKPCRPYELEAERQELEGQIRKRLERGW